MAKKVKSYRLDGDNADWLTSQGLALPGERSASWYLNDLITRCRAKVESKQVAAPAQKRKVFKKPLAGEVQNYMMEKAVDYNTSQLESEKFCDFYEMKGWMVGKNKMKDWKAAVRNWMKGKSNERNQQGTATLSVADRVAKANGLPTDAERRAEQASQAAMAQNDGALPHSMDESRGGNAIPYLGAGSSDDF